MADVTECRPKSSSTAHLAGGRLVVQEQLFLEFLDSVQPVWWPRTQADFWAEMWLWGWGAVSSLVGPSSCSEAAGPRSLSEKELSASPPHPGLSQAPLSSPPQPSHLLESCPGPASFFILLLEVTGSWPRRAHHPSPHAISLSAWPVFQKHVPWVWGWLQPRAAGCTGPSNGSLHFQACITFGVP